MTEALLNYARRLIGKPESLSGVWPRAVALLTRQALEEALHHLWEGAFPGMEEANKSTQMACLDYALSDSSLVADIRTAWASLSRACHHHHYELNPTAAELEQWIQQTERLVGALRNPG